MVSEKRREVGARIRFMVEQIGTQAKAAEVAGVTVQQLGRFMSGRNAPSFMPLAKLAQASGVNLDWVSKGEGDPKGKSVALAVYESHMEEHRFMRSFIQRLGDVYTAHGFVFATDEELDEVTGSSLEGVLDFPSTSKEQREELATIVIEAHSSALKHSALRLASGSKNNS